MEGMAPKRMKGFIKEGRTLLMREGPCQGTKWAVKDGKGLTRKGPVSEGKGLSRRERACQRGKGSVKKGKVLPRRE